MSTALLLGSLSLRDLQYAAAVAETRHFGHAAARCGVSQAALSEQLRKLEDLLGGPLFERAWRRIEPTPRGSALLPRIQNLLAAAQSLLEYASAEASSAAAPLHLGAIATLAPYYLPHLLRTLRAAVPALPLRLAEGQTAALLDRLHDGALDAVLIALPAGRDRLETAPLFAEPFLFAAPAGHQAARLPPATLARLAGPDLLLLEEGHCLRDQALGLCGQVAQEARQATSLETLWHMIAAGEGYSLVPALSAAGRAALDGLVTVHPIADPAAARRIALAWRGTDPRASQYRAIAGALRAALPPGVTPDQGAGA